MRRAALPPRSAMQGSPFVLYAIGSATGAFLAWAGLISGQLWMTYHLPALISLLLAGIAIYRFFVYKQGLAEFILFGGAFAFFHVLPLNPATWPDFKITLNKFSVKAQLYSTVWSSLFPFLCLMMVQLWHKLLPQKRDWKSFPQSAATKDRFESRVFLWFILVFIAVALPNFVNGGVIIRSINNVINMRADPDESMAIGGSVNQASTVELGSFFHLGQMAPSLFLLSIALLRSKHRTTVLMLSPLTVIWTLGNVFQGTRTYTVMFMVACAVIFFASPRMTTRGLLGAGALMAATVALCQIMMMFRGTGLHQFEWETYAAKFFNFGGNEMLIDQMRAAEYYMSGYSDFTAVGIAPIDLAIGIFYKGYEMLVYFIPRSVFPDKPVDQSLALFNIFAFSFETGARMEDTQVQAGISAGIIGRELLRWGYLGPLGAVFWFSVFIFFADRTYNQGKWNQVLRIVPGAIAGTCYISFRDLIPLFFTPLLPAAFIIWFSARKYVGFLPVSRRMAWRTPQPQTGKIARRNG